MFMTILIILLVIFISLFIMTALRDKKKKMAARSGGGHSGRQQPQARPQFTRGSRAQEPTLNQPNTKRFAADDQEYADCEQERVDVNQVPGVDSREDADEVLGLKPKSARVITKTTTVRAPEATATVRRIIIYLKSNPDSPYGGYELLQALLANHFRFGEMDIFHRHERITGEGAILFSLAAATNKGTFDLTKIGAFSCFGLSLFLNVRDQTNPMKAFDLMLDTANQLVEDLGGMVLDDQQQPLTVGKIQQWHDQLRVAMRHGGGVAAQYVTQNIID